MFFGLIWWILVGLIAGWAAGKIMKGSGYGPLMDIVLGIVGAVAADFSSAWSEFTAKASSARSSSRSSEPSF